MQDIRRNFLPNFIENVWRRHAGAPSRWAPTDGGQKPTETCVTGFCSKSVNLSLEELKNIKMILFITQERFR